MLGFVNLIESFDGNAKGIRPLFVIAMNKCTGMEHVIVIMNRWLQ
jgi:hypothetical protein